jgi:hypothetical protein
MTETETNGETSRAVRSRAFLRRATRLERLFYASIGRAIIGRPAVARGAEGFGFHKAVMPILIAFIAVNAVELFTLDLVLRRWLVAQIIVDGLDAWGIVWMIGLLCAFLMRPHTVGRDGIHVRNGLDLDVHVDWDNVRSVTRSRSVVGLKTPRVTEADDGIRELAQRSHGETNLRIDLIGPAPIVLPGPAPEGGRHTIDRIRLWADDPDAFHAAACEYL